MKTQDAIKHAGTAKALADMLKVTGGSISQWGEYPPDRRQLQLERLTNGDLKAEPGCMERALGLADEKATTPSDTASEAEGQVNQEG